MSSSKRKIVRAEFLHYRNPVKNSDKIFNIFLIVDGEDSFDCISEYGRRGSSLIRVTICSNRSRITAEREFNRKLTAKRNHRETSYDDNPAGSRDSQLVREFENAADPSRSKVTDFPGTESADTKIKPKPIGLLNQEQFDSLEL
jgi:hypothetical protein